MSERLQHRACGARTRHAARDRLKQKRCGDHGRCTKRAEVLACIENLAAGKVEHAPLGRVFRRALAAMERLRGAEINAAKSAFARPDRDIQVLEIDEETFVETPEFFEK